MSTHRKRGSPERCLRLRWCPHRWGGAQFSAWLTARGVLSPEGSCDITFATYLQSNLEGLSCVLWPWPLEFICSHWFLVSKPLDYFLEPADNQANWVRLSYTLPQPFTQGNRFPAATLRGVTYWPLVDMISLLTKQNWPKLLWLMPGPFSLWGQMSEPA